MQSIRWKISIIASLMIALNIQAAETNRPNVVIIVSDDHGFNDIGWNNKAVKTPVLERLASEGCRLDRFYANPICSVTRAALMTGISTIKTGVNNRQGLGLKYRILPQVFKESGYQTWMFGKWHLGGSEDNAFNTPEYLPHQRGFDYFYGFLHGAIDYYTHERKDLGKLDWQRNGKPVIEEGFTTDLLVDDASRKIVNRDKSKPFLLYLPFNGVHGPLQAPPSAENVSRRDRRAILLANITHVDSAIGRLMKTLEKEGIQNNTLVLFFGDNGGQISNGAINVPLRGEKGGTFEGGIREPALIYWPGVIKSGQVSQQFMSVMDVLPTLCSATSIKTGMDTRIDGQDLWPALLSGKVQEHPPFVIGNRDTALFSGTWKMVNPAGGEPPLLFDIVKDPNETTDLAAQNSDLIAKLSRELSSLGGLSKGKGGGDGVAKKAKRPQMEPGKAAQKKQGGRNAAAKKQQNQNP